MRRSWAIIAIMGLGLTASLLADEPRVTVVQVELLAGTDGGALAAQEWRSEFERLDVSVRIRRGLLKLREILEARA